MASLTEKINNDIKQALREKKAAELSVLRMLLAALKNKKIELGNKDELTDERAVGVIRTEVKKRKDSIAAYEQGARQDLADKEAREIEILAAYLPKEMSDGEIELVARETVAALGEVGPKDFGRVMGQTMAKLAGKADGARVSEAVKKVLNG